jgi:flavin-dependent dehydrogenase
MVSSPSGRTARFPLPRGEGVFAAIARRIDLDAALLHVARDAGVRVHEGHAVTSVDQRPDRVVVHAEGLGDVHARYLVAADGMWSPVRKLVAPEAGAAGPYLGEWHAFRQYFTGVGPAARDLWVWFEPDILPGYAWSFPLPDGRANVGFGIQRGGRVSTQDMKALWPELLRRPRIAEVLGPAAKPELPHRAWPIPARIDGVALASGRTLFAGDAAAACDPLTGEGIGQALLTGIAASRAISHGGPDRPHAVRAHYEQAVRRELLADHHMSMLLIRALRHRRGARAAVAIAGSTPWTRRNFGRWLFEDYPRAVLATPDRWHRGMFTGTGAYRR